MASSSGGDARTLSSAQTFLMKFVFPVVWIGMFALFTLTMFLSPGAFHDQGGEPADASLKWFFLFATVVGTAFIRWLCFPLKRVRMDERSLYVSNYRDDINVPLADVDRVTENRWVNIHPVTIHLHRETEFGSSIVFMPKIRIFAFWSSHPVVADIRAAVERATGRAAS
jgi:hypothetical protein